MRQIKVVACAAILCLSAVAGIAKADISFSGSGSSGVLVGPDEVWSFNADGGSLENDWGSPGVGAGITTYDETMPTFGMSITFSGGGTVDSSSIAIGNASACAGSTNGGTTFCNISAGDDIFEAFQTAPDTIEFLSQSPANNLVQGSQYFVNVFFDGATPTSFTGSWLTTFTPVPSGTPEPATWALMLAGVGAIGLTLRRARKMGFKFNDAFAA